MTRIMFSAIWSDALGAEIKARSTKPYPMEFHENSDDFRSLFEAVNMGIDSHLEAVVFEDCSFGSYGRRKFKISPETLHVLVRRLMEADDENSQSLASGICETLDIELV